MSLKGLLTIALALVPFIASEANAREWFVSASRGKGKKGTIEKPAKDMGNIIKKLAPGDVIKIAAGTYLGKGKKGSDWIKVPVSILGGFNEKFTERDPWGKFKTVLTGSNTEGYVPQPRLHLDLTKYKQKAMPQIIIDGLIIDQGPQNNYKGNERKMLVRKASPKTGRNPSPDRGAMVVSVSKTGDLKGKWKIFVQNNVIANAAPTQGAMSVSAYKGSKVYIQNNAIINCTGSSLLVGSKFSGKEDPAQFTVQNNTILFSWKYDAYVQSFSGNGVKIMNYTKGTLQNNVMLFADRFGILKSDAIPWLIKGNVVGFNVEADYYEQADDAKMKLADMEDEAEYLADGSEKNVIGKMTIPVSKAWTSDYGQRTLINRNAVEADIQPQKTAANQIRSILGLNLRADSIKADSAVWLHQMSLDDVMKAAVGPYSGYGAKKPAVQKK